MSEIQSVIDNIFKAQALLKTARLTADRVAFDIKYPPEPEPKIEVGQIYLEPLSKSRYAIAYGNKVFSFQSGELFMPSSKIETLVKDGRWVLVP